VELRQLRTFTVVARQGTVTGAALELDLAPSSVSEQVRALERSLGVALFERRPSGMHLTHAGRTLLARAGHLMAEAERVRREVAGGAPIVRLGALETLAAVHVPAILARLGRRRPDISLQVQPLHRRDELLARVGSASLDACLLLDTGAVLGGLGFTVDIGPERLAFLDLDQVPLALVAAPIHPLAGVAGVRWTDVANHRLLLTEPGCSYRLVADRLFDPQGPRLEAGALTVARAWAAEGLGVALLPRFAVAAELESGRVVCVNLVGDMPELTLRLVWRADREAEPDLRAVLYAAADPGGSPTRLGGASAGAGAARARAAAPRCPGGGPC
jgi:DNA-binding transcriptional LysR family regulator